MPLTGGTITGNLTVNSFINSLSSISATNVLEGKSDIWHWGDIKVLNKDLSNMEAWVQRKTYYSDGVNLSKIGTASIDTITFAKKADYSSNVASNYTARSFTDKNYVDSSLRHRQKIINDANYTLEDSISIGDTLQIQIAKIDYDIKIAKVKDFPLNYKFISYSD